MATDKYIWKNSLQVSISITTGIFLQLSFEKGSEYK